MSVLQIDKPKPHLMIKPIRLLALHLCFFPLCFIACKNSANQQVSKLSDSAAALQTWNKSVQGGFSDQQTLLFDSIQLDSFLIQYIDFKSYKAELKHFYQKQDYTYVWFDENGLIEQAGNLIDRVSNIQKDGIFTPLPYKNKLDSLISEYHQNKDTEPLLELEFMLTSQYFSFAHKVWQGMDASVSEKESWFLPRKTLSYEVYLDSLLKASKEQTPIADAPVYRQYHLLKAYLEKFTSLQNQPWTTLQLSGKSLKLGDSDPLIPELRKRLILLEAFTKEGSTDSIFDSDLFEAVKDYQARMGLNADGVIGPGTIRALNITPKSRIRTILVNMERSRWLPLSLKEDYIAVNIPEFKLHVYHSDSLLWSSNVVVGKDVHKTVIFSGEIQYIVFSPYWNIPSSIVRNEIVPAMQKDKDYLSKKRMEITGYSGGLPIVRQKPGPGNSLGQVKFLFPNSHNIYLHDTPAKPLFNEASRAFSHGCVRVQDPEKLAAFLLKRDTTWNAGTIHDAMQKGEEKWVVLKHKTPVFLTYLTAFVDRDGKINFREDVYQRDERLAEMLIH